MYETQLIKSQLVEIYVNLLLNFGYILPELCGTEPFLASSNIHVGINQASKELTIPYSLQCKDFKQQRLPQVQTGLF